MHLLHLWASSQTEMTDFPGFLHTTTRETPILSGGASPYNVYVIKGLTPPPPPSRGTQTYKSRGDPRFDSRPYQHFLCFAFADGYSFLLTSLTAVAFILLPPRLATTVIWWNDLRS